MYQYAQFILWIGVPSASRPGKTDKFPIHPTTGRKHNAHDRSIHLSYDQAQTALQSGICDQPGITTRGIGFVITEDDPFFFIDVDAAADAAGQWSPLAVDLCTRFAGCYVEVSQSGRGLHIIGSYNEEPDHSIQFRRPPHDEADLYTANRFCALTGLSATGSAATLADAALAAAIQTYWTPADPVTAADWTDGPCPEWYGPTDDDALIARMLDSRNNPFSNKCPVQKLWDGGQAAYDHYFNDRSSTDAALLQALAFWTGRDCERMDRLFRRSGLYRDKWDRGAGGGMTYAQRSILKEVSRCRNVLGSNRQTPSADEPDAPEPADADGYRVGSQLMSVNQQIEHFRGCVYVTAHHAILTPGGDLLDQGRFRAIYGGRSFVTGADNAKTTKSAWEAFTECQNYDFPKVADVCFRPECPPGAIIVEEGRKLVNTYIPVDTPRQAGDPGRILNHIALMLPDPGDQAILLAYMAAVVQHPGIKFQWAPLLVGTEGNGKTLIARCLAAAVGHRYTHTPNAQDLNNKFNAWLQGKLFIGIEEVYTTERAELIEALKPMITNSRIEIQAKGGDQVTGDNRANFVLCSNHRDAIRKTGTDRRYAIFFTAQQDADDIVRQGMGGNYFPELYNWLEREGYAIMNNYLREYVIPAELNPAVNAGGLSHRAPTTSSTAEAIKASLGAVEQEILEAIEEGRVGFCGGWISSLQLERMLIEKHMSARMPRNKRKEVLGTLGYVPHDALPGGRCNGVIPLDNGKPVLYVKRHSLPSQLQYPADVVSWYVKAQGGATDGGAAVGFAALGAGSG